MKLGKLGLAALVAASVLGSGAALAQAKRPSVIWLSFQECTGCSESLLRSSHPTVSNLILDMISLDYHETLMAGSGHQAEKSLHDSMAANKGKYILVVEGGIPTKDNGIYCKVSGKTALESLRTAAEGAAAVISIGTCASYGGIQASAPNPTGAVGVGDIVKDADRLPLERAFRVAPAILAHNVQREQVQRLIASELNAYLSLEGQRSLGELLAEYGLRDPVRGWAVAQVDREARGLFAAPAFAQWLAAVLGGGG